MKTTGVSCETKFGLLGFLGHPIVEQTFSSLVELKHKLCWELLEEAYETVLMGHASPKK